MLEILGDGNFWAVLSGTLTAAAFGVPRGYKFVKALFQARAQVNHQSDLIAEKVKLELLLQAKDKIIADKDKTIERQEDELERVNRNYNRLERLYDRQLEQSQAIRFDSLEDELAELKVKVNQNGRS